MFNAKDTMVQFMVENLNTLDKSDIQPLFNKVYAKVLSEKTGAFFYEGGGRHNYIFLEAFNTLKYQVDTTLSIDDQLTAFYDYVANTLKLDYTLFLALLANRSILELGKFSYNPLKDSYRYVGTNKPLVALLLYVIDGYYNIHSSAREGDLIDQLGIYASQQFTIENISVKQFQNGRIDIKGMTEEQEARLKEICKAANKLNNRI